MRSANACFPARTLPQRTPEASPLLCSPPPRPVLKRGVPPTLSATLLLVSTVSVPLLTLGCGSGTLAELHLPCLCSHRELAGPVAGLGIELSAPSVGGLGRRPPPARGCSSLGSSACLSGGPE